jgi:PAS domain S-box-containing protein
MAPAFTASTPDLFEAFFDLALIGGMLFAPVRDAAQKVVDFTYVRLNPAAQQMLALPEHPPETFLTLYPNALQTGVFAFYREAFEAGEARRGEFNYQHDGLDNYFHLAARRLGEQLLVSFTDTSEQPRSAVEEALRESQAREQAARAEADLQRKRFHEVLLQLPAQVATYHGPDHVFTFVNQRFSAFVPAQNLLGRPVREAAQGAVGQEVFALLDRVYATGEPVHLPELEVVLDHHDDAPAAEPLFVTATYLPLHDGEGHIYGVLDFSYEVTEQVLARRQVQQLNQELESRVVERTSELEAARAATERQRRQWEELFWRAPAAICIFDGPEWVYEFVNPGYQAMFPGQQLLGKRLTDVFPEVVAQPLLAILRQVYDTGEPFEGREVLVPLARTAGGPIEEIYFDLTYQARYNEAGQIDGFVTYAYDVTPQVRARQRQEAYAAELQESEARFRTLADAAPNMVWDLTPEGSVRYVNKYCLEFLGITLKEFVASDWGPYLLPEDVAPTEQILGRAIAERTLFSMEHRMRRRDGQYRWLLTQGGPSYFANGELYGYVGSAIDINDLKQANEQLRRTNHDLDTFVYTASHDLKAPITNIESILHALRETLPPAVQQEEVMTHILGLLDHTVGRFRTTIDQLTDLTRLQQTYNEPAELLRLAPVVADVLADLAPAVAAAAAHVQVDVPADLQVSFAPASLRSVVYNLLSNAVKYRDPARPAQVWLHAEQQAGTVVLTVRDNGLGLTESQQQRLFGVFQRLHTHVEGTGVGLYMIKRLIENAGARITVTSTPGVGSIFTVTFPAK